MAVPPKNYPEDHWLRSEDVRKVLDAYLEQQSKAYSRVKNAFINELLGDLQGKRFLDYGCGAGGFTVYAAGNGAVEAVGVDAQPTALDAARYYAAREGLAGRCTFIHSSTFPVLGKTAPFDVILLKDVIEHVPDDVGLLHAAARALVPGGKAIVSTQNALSLNYLLEGLYQRYIAGNRDWMGWDETHVRFYTPYGLAEKLRQVGLNPVRWRSVYIVPHKFPGVQPARKRFIRIEALSRIDSLLGGMFPYNRLGWNVIVEAEVSPLVSVRIRDALAVTPQPAV